MLYQEFKASAILRPYIEKIWSLETGPGDAYPMEHMITPNGTEGLILSYQKVAQKFILNGEDVVLPEAYMFIQPLAPWTVVTTGCSGIIGVFFKAGSLHTLFQTSMNELIGHVIEPQAFLGNKPIRCLLEKLSEIKPEYRIALVENFFIKYFNTVASHPKTTQNAVNLIRQYDGMVSIEQLSNYFNISRRGLSKQFYEKVGISPKYYSRTVRFSAVQRYLMTHPKTSWLDITHKFKYFDQSHLIKDFYNFTGSSPLDYTTLDTFLTDRFLLPDVNDQNA
jgi:AraC-like DNA-binding protein